MSKFKNQKPFALITLTDAAEETHIIIAGKHYQIGVVEFFTDADALFCRNQALNKKGVESVLLNTHALLTHFYSHEMECIERELGIDVVNYDIAQ
ncbi:hypothetical protein RFH42_10535 [Acinetobacter rudis]|uniref:hypothetical protein n=1 Tax=Acinetobacter rudis TaxID=632955 RepID=UPI00280D7F35|nr:hypothetical protein [Acinetobacter rudis]MDQ8953395.1 hypothetical protein [Acinetobacter rudis]